MQNLILPLVLLIALIFGINAMSPTEAMQKTSVTSSNVDFSSFKIDQLLSSNDLIGLLGLLTLISVITSMWLYRWRKVASEGKQIMVPESFQSHVNEIVNGIKHSEKVIGKGFNMNTKSIQQFDREIQNFGQSVQSLVETLMTMHTALDEKEKEIQKYKEGYDASIFKKFLLRFTRVDTTIKDYLYDNSIDIEGLQDIQELMEDALQECGLEVYEPEIGSDYRKNNAVADNPKKVMTENPEQHFLINEVFQPAYRRQQADGEFDYIVKSKVSIYVYNDENK